MMLRKTGTLASSAPSAGTDTMLACSIHSSLRVEFLQSAGDPILVANVDCLLLDIHDFFLLVFGLWYGIATFINLSTMSDNSNLL